MNAYLDTLDGGAGNDPYNNAQNLQQILGKILRIDVDGKDGDLKGDRALKKGRKVTAYYSSKMTRSYPPQAEGFAIVFGKNNEKQGKYMHVEKVTPSENGESVRLLNSNRDIIVTVSKDVYEDYQNIKEGDRIMAWYSIMTMSLPGQTNATKVIVLP